MRSADIKRRWEQWAVGEGGAWGLRAIPETDEILDVRGNLGVMGAFQSRRWLGNRRSLPLLKEL